MNDLLHPGLTTSIDVFVYDCRCIISGGEDQWRGTGRDEPPKVYARCALAALSALGGDKT